MITGPSSCFLLRDDEEVPPKYISVPISVCFFFSAVCFLHLQPPTLTHLQNIKDFLSTTLQRYTRYTIVVDMSGRQYSNQRKPGREHWPLYPKGFIGLRIVQLVLAILDLGLSAYIAAAFGDINLSLPGANLTIFAVGSL